MTCEGGVIGKDEITLAHASLPFGWSISIDIAEGESIYVDVVDNYGDLRKTFSGGAWPEMVRAALAYAKTHASGRGS